MSIHKICFGAKLVKTILYCLVLYQFKNELMNFISVRQLPNFTNVRKGSDQS